jgi:argininosuccinate lyase
VPVLEIDREFTARAMGFAGVLENPVYAQNSRGKFDALILDVLSSVMLTLNKLATDVILFSSEEFGYVTLGERICTGSSIMPQKKNPDIFEVLRGNFHVVTGAATQVRGLAADLISGYHRDVQLSKGPMMRALQVTEDSLVVAAHGVRNIDFDPNRCESSLTPELFATERAYRMVRDLGIPFREAYRRVADEIYGGNDES